MARHDLGQAFADHVLSAGFERAHRAVDIGLFGDDVIGSTSVDLRDRDDQIIMGKMVAADNRLNGIGHAHSGHDGVSCFMGGRTVPALARDVDMKSIDSGEDGTGRGVERANGRAGGAVQGIDLGNVETVQDPLLHHDLRTAAALFGRLKNEGDPPCKIAGLRQIARGTQQHGRVPVVAAGMHLARIGRGIVKARLLIHRQGIHIGTQSNCRPGRLAVQNGHHTRGRNPFVDFIHPEFAQTRHNKRRRLVAVELQLWVRMQMPAPRGHVLGEIGDTIDNGHLWRSGLSVLRFAVDRNKGPCAMADNTLIFDPNGGMPRLLEIMRRLRDPQTGCPWDIEQDFDSIAPYTIEEAYEVADAIARQDWGDLEGELGDLLLQTVYHTQMGAEAGQFTFDSVVKAISDKMVARHPHVFGDESRDKSAAQQTADWEKIKAAERAGKAQSRTLDGVATGLPALTRAVKLQKRAARVGFDWPDTTHVIDKIVEEAGELVEARNQLTQTEVEEEFGDLLFVVANLARHLEIDPEAALRAANAKFTRRFEAVEDALAAQGKTPDQSDLAEMDALWNQVKTAEKGL